MDEPEELRAVPVISFLDMWIERAQNEVASHVGRIGRHVYSSLAVLCLQLRAHALDFPEALEKYEEDERALDIKYFGSPIEKSLMFSTPEAEERLQHALQFWREIGPGRIDEKNLGYSGRLDNIEFKDWVDEK